MSEAAPETPDAKAQRLKQARSYESTFQLAGIGVLAIFLIIVFGIAWAAGPWLALAAAPFMAVLVFGALMAGAALTRANYYFDRWE